ncbi:MAG TPA: large conductance mechanosensitive channel protein MscL [Actinomycetota bacterium]|nr:large conductance mechanosensitive channel protein MscL [Actinomycetota bacterium]
MLKDFKQFLLRGNVVDLAVGIVIGAAFGAVVTGFVTAFITPLIGLAAGKADLSKLLFTVGDPKTGTQFPYGLFLNALIAFVLIAAAVFFFVVRPINQLMARRKTEPPVDPTVRDCPECLSSIPKAARRCAFCTAEVQPAA